MRTRALVLSLALVVLVSLGTGPCLPDAITIPGLSEPVDISTDDNGVWHFVAANDFDLARQAANDATRWIVQKAPRVPTA